MANVLHFDRNAKVPRSGLLRPVTHKVQISQDSRYRRMKNRVTSPMMAMQDVCTSLRFSTDGLPEAARAKVVRELYERTRIEALPDCVVRVDIVKFALPGLGVISGMLGGLGQAARPRGSASSEDDLFLGVTSADGWLARTGC